MGKYINNNSKGQGLGRTYRQKLDGLIADGAIIVSGNEYVGNLIAVVDNGTFGAAAYAYSEGEYKYFKDSFAGNDDRPHTWLVHPKAEQIVDGYVAPVTKPAAEKPVSEKISFTSRSKAEVHSRKEVQAYILAIGGTSSYSGHSTMTFVKHTRRQRGEQQKQGWNYHPQRTMYINDPKKGQPVESIESAILNKFGYSLPFKLVTN